MAKVLVVDDDTSLREALYDRLTGKGHEVMASNAGAHAMELLKSHRPEVILLDTSLPRESGVQVAMRIREFDRSVPIALLKGVGEPEPPAADLERIGNTQVLRKELGVDLLLGEVDRFIKEGERQRQAPGLRSPGLQGSFLLVDDDPAALKMTKLLFESRGFQVMTAGSGEEALKALAKKPQVVLLDMSMPGMDGLMTLKKIKAVSPNLPVIMVSAHGEEEIVREALKAGAYDYVQKPFSVEYLETIVLTKMLVGMKG